MLERKKWVPIALIIFLAQLVLEGYALFQIIRMNMLPLKYLFVIACGLAVLLLVTCVLLFAGIGHGPGIGRRVRRIIALILALLFGAGSVYVARVATKVNETVDTVTTNTSLDAMVGVYVLKDNVAETIQDAVGYTFGLMEDFDQDNTSYAVDAIQKELGQEIRTEGESSMTETAAALYAGSVDGMIMNEAYVGVLEETEDYADFSEKTKLIYEVPVQKTETVSGEENAENTSAEEDIGSSQITETPFVVYISGSDTRSKMLDTSRSDVNILMCVNPSTKQILLLNTPRDYYVPNPAGDGAMDKLTHCGIYGVDCSEKALGDLYDTEVNYYAQINFTGFETLIDEIGGITVNSPVAFEAGGYSYVEGENRLNGEQALAFARERYSLSGGDNDRGKNQMRVITAVLEEMTSSGSEVLLNYSGILDSLQGMFVTDLSSAEISALVKMQLDDMTSWNIKSYAVSGQGGSDYSYSMPNAKAYVMYQDEAKVAHAAELIDKVFNGEILSDADIADAGSADTEFTDTAAVD